MKIVYAKHENSEKEYIFEVPECMSVKKGDILYVETMRGPQIALAVSDELKGDYPREILLKLGAYFPLKRVLACANKEMQRYIFNNAVNGMICILENEKIEEDIPF